LPVVTKWSLHKINVGCVENELWTE
jgi:hypothetical protein